MSTRTVEFSITFLLEHTHKSDAEGNAFILVIAEGSRTLGSVESEGRLPECNFKLKPSLPGWVGAASE